MSSQPTTASSPHTRRLYKGSCHCGFQKYQIHLTLPPPVVHPRPPYKETVRLRKCNCTTCHKMSFFHVRLPDSVNDFRLLSPLDPKKELGDYKCGAGEIHWYFCPKCGVRCFAFMGEGEVREAEVEGNMVKYWAPKEPWAEGTDNGCYLSVNAATLEAQQEGLDLREWHEKGWITYLDWLGEKPNDNGEDRMGVPHIGGMY